MSDLAGDITKEIIGAFVLGITAVMFIFILVTFGEATGQSEITNQAIQTILIIVGGIGIPIGIIALIKWLGDFSHGNYY